MSDLIKRIDGFVYQDYNEALWRLLEDCRAEIASLHDVAQQQAVVIERLTAENKTLKHNCAHYADLYLAEIERLRTYTPMTDDERWRIFMFGESEQIGETLAEFEAAVIKRAGLGD